MRCWLSLAVTSGQNSSQEIEYQLAKLVRMCLKRKMPGIEQMNLG